MNNDRLKELLVLAIKEYRDIWVEGWGEPDDETVIYKSFMENLKITKEEMQELGYDLQ